MTGFRVDPDVLARGDAVLSGAVQHARDVVADVSVAAQQLLDGGWQGAAAATFRDGWTHWLAGTTSMLDALEAAAVALGQASAGYVSTDEGVRSNVARAAS